MIEFLLVCIIIVLVAAVSGLYWRAQDAEDKAHAKCIAHIAHYVGDEYAAMVLSAAAHDYDSAEEFNHLKVLARMKYQAGGPSMPAIWLRDRADHLRGDGSEEVREEAV